MSNIREVKGRNQKKMFECTRCGKRFEPKGFESPGTFYTLCEECGEEVLAFCKKE